MEKNPREGLPPGELLRDQYDPYRFLEEQWMRLTGYEENPDKIRDEDYRKGKQLSPERDHNKYRMTWFNGVIAVVEGALAENFITEPNKRKEIMKKLERLKRKIATLNEEKGKTDQELMIEPGLVDLGDTLLDDIYPYVVHLEIDKKEKAAS